MAMEEKGQNCEEKKGHDARTQTRPRQAAHTLAVLALGRAHTSTLMATHCAKPVTPGHSSRVGHCHAEHG